MNPDRPSPRTLATKRSSESQLSLGDLIPTALGAAGLLMGPTVAHASLIGVLGGCAGAATFFGGSLVVLRTFGRSLVPAVLVSAASGAAGAIVYWLVARPDLTAVGTTGLGAIAGAAIAPFELIWVQFRREMAQLEAHSDFEYTGLFSTLWRAVRAIRAARRQLRGSERRRIDGGNGAA